MSWFTPNCAELNASTASTVACEIENSKQKITKFRYNSFEVILSGGAATLLSSLNRVLYFIDGIIVFISLKMLMLINYGTE